MVTKNVDSKMAESGPRRFYEELAKLKLLVEEVLGTLEEAEKISEDYNYSGFTSLEKIPEAKQWPTSEAKN